jgi:hypothetical protein
MDKRLIFRYRSRTIQSQVRAGRAKPIAALELLRLTAQAAVFRGSLRGGGKPVKGNSAHACLQEKRIWGCRERPYRKPTLVAGHKCAKVDE